MEERLDRLIALMESQNKAWERSLQLLNAIHTLMVEKYKSGDLLLEQHPAVKGPAPVTVGKARQPQPFNDYSDSTPYGTELEEERDAAADTQSFPAAPTSMSSASETVVLPPESPASQQSPQKSSASERVETLEQPVQSAPKRAVTSKAEMLQQQENFPQ